MPGKIDKYLSRTISFTFKKGHTMLEMLNRIVNAIVNYQWSDSYQTSLDVFIASKNPCSPADIEFWTREHARRNFSQGVI